MGFPKNQSVVCEGYLPLYFAGYFSVICDITSRSFTSDKKVMNLSVSAWFSIVVLSALHTAHTVQAANVVVSIPPLAGLIAPLLGENDQLHVLLQPGVSPHGFQLKPSHLKQLTQADLIVAVGSPVDQWMHKASNAQTAVRLNMLELPGLEKLPLRQGGLWESHRAKDTPKNQHDHDHEHESNMAYDGHLWMSWTNAVLLVNAVSAQLQRANPTEVTAIQQRTQAWLTRLNASQTHIAGQLKPFTHHGFLVLHDAFQYFEHQFGLKGMGSIRLNPELPPSLKRIDTLREKIKTGQVRCIFKEPQFPEKNVLAVVQGLSVNIGQLDPMGSVYVFEYAQRNPNESKRDYVNYDVMMQGLADAFSQCLTQ
ncbi:zinc ABC transporter substrate-binding protein [Thiomicrorhabdus aquaedulcis]|uniref:zinc ABC transporter substrate-binding protein n=1 Tax=Thiomicrorhabdus aquaedulcis TaxID=2211106 RepID=UPI0015620793|nr:zinc ABC transporter substrate-binding protein [Thiomicrorhabdus aquaedulcis]